MMTQSPCNIPYFSAPKSTTWGYFYAKIRHKSSTVAQKQLYIFCGESAQSSQNKRSTPSIPKPKSSNNNYYNFNFVLAIC
jgi:hypothetical protein